LSGHEWALELHGRHAADASRGPLRLLSDDRLVRRVARGDAAAFALIAERHEQGLLRHCRAILRNEEDARDAVQSTFERALRALENERRAIALRPWLYRIAHNEAVSLMRRRRPTGSLDEETADRGASVESRVLMSERLQQLLGDLGDLPERQSGALLMRELSGLGYAEIGVALETSEQAARQCVYEARVMLFELAKGREMGCDDVRRRVSARDGRLLRPRHVRAHLRACEDCNAFREAIGGRRAELAALGPPAAPLAGTGLLRALLSGGHESSGRLADTIVRAADPLATTLTAKGAALVAAATLAGGGSLLAQHAHVHSPPSGVESGKPALAADPASSRRTASHVESGGSWELPGRARPAIGTESSGRLPDRAHPAPASAQPLAGQDDPLSPSLEIRESTESPAATPDRHGGEHAPPAPSAPQSTAHAAPQPAPAADPAPAGGADAGEGEPGNGNANGGSDASAHTSKAGPENQDQGNQSQGQAQGSDNPGSANAAAGNGDAGNTRGGAPAGAPRDDRGRNDNSSAFKASASGSDGQDRAAGQGR
jgi:RNA polymerase sigma factor (sigma-70 family)